MDNALEFLKYGVLGFSTIAIIYSFQVVHKEQAREGEARKSILDFSNKLLKYAVLLTVILSAVQIYEKIIVKETVTMSAGKTIKWSAQSQFYPEPPMQPDEDGLINLDASFVGFDEARIRKNKMIDETIALCGQNLTYSVPLISPNNPAKASQVLILNGQVLNRPVLIEIEKGIGLENGPFGTFPKWTEYASYKLDLDEVVKIDIAGATNIMVVPVKCL